MGKKGTARKPGSEPLRNEKNGLAAQGRKTVNQISDEVNVKKAAGTTTPSKLDIHRRERAWAILYTSRLNTCYWTKIHCRHQRIAIVVNSAVALLVFGIGVSPIAFEINWNPAILVALISLVTSMVVLFPVNSTTHKCKVYCRQWSELKHDAELLWKEGEDLSWKRQNVVATIERLDARVRAYQSNELHDPHKRLLVGCERQLYEQLNRPFPPKE